MISDPISLPHNFIPRDYQLPALTALYRDGMKRAVLVWHRRAGKDKTCLNLLIAKMFEKVGSYYYFFPTYAQGKKIVWDGIDADGLKFINHFPPETILKKNDSDLKVELLNGSIMQIIGTDNYDSVVGTNPIGCVFSEYALQDPRAWDYIRPILLENKGWAIFEFTPRGENHAYDMLRMAKNNPDWFVSVLTVDDTKRADGSPVITKAMIEQERAEGMAEEIIQQEYYCSFTAGMHGSYYGKEMRQAGEENRICAVPYQPALPVATYWDLGIADYMAIWFVQRVGLKHHVIDYLEAQGEGLQYYIRQLQQKGYIYGKHWAPHDIMQRELTSGKSRLELAKDLGIAFNVVPNLSVEDGINATRGIIGQCWFDETKCKLGIDALKSYHKEWDEKRKVFKDRPHHDWSSHSADAFRMFAVGYQDERPKQKTGRPVTVTQSWMGA